MDYAVDFFKEYAVDYEKAEHNLLQKNWVTTLLGDKPEDVVNEILPKNAWDHRENVNLVGYLDSSNRYQVSILWNRDVVSAYEISSFAFTKKDALFVDDEQLKELKLEYLKLMINKAKEKGLRLEYLKDLQMYSEAKLVPLLQKKNDALEENREFYENAIAEADKNLEVMKKQHEDKIAYLTERYSESNKSEELRFRVYGGLYEDMLSLVEDEMSEIFQELDKKGMGE